MFLKIFLRRKWAGLLALFQFGLLRDSAKHHKVCTVWKQQWGLAFKDMSNKIGQWPWFQCLCVKRLHWHKESVHVWCLSFSCTWKWAGNLLGVPKCCFVCGWVLTPNCHPSADTSHRLGYLWVSEQGPDRDQNSRKEICSTNTGSCQWILALWLQRKPLRTVFFVMRWQVCNH